MRKSGLASRSRKSERGAALIEFTAVVGVLMVFLLGTVDLCIIMMNWASYNRATYTGARFAAVSDPVATGINNTIAAAGSGATGDTCINATDGTASGKCTIKAATTCTATNANGSTGTCPGYTYNAAAMQAIVTQMNSALIIGSLDPRQVSVTYTPSNVGFVSRPNGSPINLTVSLSCVQSQLFFINYLMRWVLPTPASCNGFTPPKGLPLPGFATTLPSEDLTTN